MSTICPWTKGDPIMIKYHNEEWGKPVHNDHKHFEFLVLDAFQAGLSWKTILHKRQAFKKAFAQFNPKKVALFNQKDIERLMQNEKIIRNKQKIESAVNNAQAFLKVQKIFGSFDKFIWQFTDNTTIKNKWKNHNDLPASTKESEAMSKALKKHGFSFVGPTICYAYMQAAGMVNDHIVACPLYKDYD